MALALDLSGRVVLVTGGRRGIGLGITEAFRAAGARVLTCSRSEVDAPDHYVCDVRDPDAVQALVTQVVADAGRLDVLVNNAGGAPYALAAARLGPLPRQGRRPQPARPVGLRSGGQRGDAAAGGRRLDRQRLLGLRRAAVARHAAYGAAKAGLDSLTSSLAVEWGPKVRVNSIDVGMCRTDDTADHYGGDAQVAAIERTIPLGRMARPEEVGHVAVFLASDLASYVSGARVECHGGGEPPVFLAALEGSS